MPVEALAVQLALHLVIEAGGGPVQVDEPDELLEPGQRLLGDLDPAEVEAESPIIAVLPPAGT